MHLSQTVHVFHLLKTANAEIENNLLKCTTNVERIFSGYQLLSNVFVI